jgi:AcrR family transcriptional regulator
MPPPRPAHEDDGRPRTRGGWDPVGTAAGRRAVHAERGTARGQRTRTLIVDAARRVFERDGYVDANVDGIVAEAGVSRGSFYTYFPSKREVFRELAAAVGERVSRAVAAEPDGHLDPVAALERSNRRYVEVYRDNAALYGLIEQIATMDEAGHRQRLASRQAHVERVAATIRRWQARGVADPGVDPPTTAGALVSMTSNFCYWWFVGDDPYDTDAACATLNQVWVRAVDLRRRPRPSWR